MTKAQDQNSLSNYKNQNQLIAIIVSGPFCPRSCFCGIPDSVIAYKL